MWNQWLNRKRKLVYPDNKDRKFTRCLSPEHNPPMHLYIPPGRTYTHVCPSCGFTVTLRGNDVSC